jgi:hypothetical protein
VIGAGTLLMCATGYAFPSHWNRRLMRKARGVRLPSRRGAARTLAVFVLASLAVGTYLIQSEGLDSLLTTRQVALANKGYLLVLLSAGAAAWLVYLAVVGRPQGRRAWAVVLITGAGALAPLLVSGARSIAILGLAIPAALLIYFLIWRFPGRVIAAGLVALVALAVVIRVTVREPSYAEPAPAASSEAVDPWIVRDLDPVLGGTEAAGLDGLVLARTEYLPTFGVDPALSAKAFVGAPVPRSIWPDKPRSAMDTFTERLNPVRYSLGQVGQGTSLAGELTMNWGPIGMFAGFVLFAVYLCFLGELASGTAGVLGVLVATALLPRVASAMWGDSFNSTWGGIALVLMILLAVAIGHGLARRPSAAGSAKRRRMPRGLLPIIRREPT